MYEKHRSVSLTHLMKAQVGFDGVRCVKDFTVAGQDEKETVECLPGRKINMVP